MFEAIVDFTDFLWGTPLMILMVGVGLYISFRIGFFQITGLGVVFRKTFGEMFKKNAGEGDEGSLTPGQALSTVLAGTIGSGNIAGVAAAIAIGGPGAVFWMWVIAIVGMVTKMAEVTLAVKYRKKSETGEFYGGPMHYIRDGLGGNWKILAGVYSVALFIMVLTDACGIQIHTMSNAAYDVFNIPHLVTGVVVVAISMAIIFGGIGRIGAFCAKMVPPMAALYIVGAIVVIIAHASEIPAALALIFKYAFAPAPAVGGFAGSTIALAMGRGAARGIFSNEAGMGTAATVHATVKTDHPAHQGFYGIVEVFIDTIVVCTLTALSILCSGVWSNGNSGVVLTFDAFRTVWGSAGMIVACVSVILFCYSSYLGFFIEYRTSVEHLFGEKAIKYMQWLFFILPILAVTLDVESIWSLADIAVGFIVIPNMIALVALSGKFVGEFKDYKQKLAGEAGR